MLPTEKPEDPKFYHFHRGWKRHCLSCLARLRGDGFACYELTQPGGTGTVVTRPLRCSGEPLRISADAKGGSVRVAVLGTEGFGLDDCQLVAEDVTDGVVKWKGGKDLSLLQGKTIRLKFELKLAKLYPFSGLELGE